MTTIYTKPQIDAMAVKIGVKIKEAKTTVTQTQGQSTTYAVSQKMITDSLSAFGTAAGKNVGTAAGNVMEVGAFGLGVDTPTVHLNATNLGQSKSSFVDVSENITGLPSVGYNYTGINIRGDSGGTILATPYPDNAAIGLMGYNFVTYDYAGAVVRTSAIWTDKNTTVDGSGFIKKASPIVNLHSDRIELNWDAEHQGLNITFEKLGKGDYLVKGSLGFAQEGWYIENPKDANGNVLVAVVYEQLANNDISVKTYAKKFDEETGDIVPNLLRPLEIKTDRFISLRLHELPKEPSRISQRRD